MRIALGVEYDGHGFRGWQTQLDGLGVQDALERALRQIAGEPVEAVCAGRTDAGVHALGQVVHFDCSAERPDQAWVRGTNALLDKHVAVLWARRVDNAFHARHSARERCYRYFLLDSPVRPALDSYKVGWTHRRLDIDAMRIAARHLIGQHDFSSFRSSECQARTAVRHMRHIAIERQQGLISFEFRADAYLHHMVRNIVGALVYVGSGRQPSAWLQELLNGRNRSLGAPTFSAAGLYLWQVSYPSYLLPAVDTTRTMVAGFPVFQRP